MVEAIVAILDYPALCHRVGSPVEGDAVGCDVAGGESGDIGADGSGEGHSVAPVAFEQVGTAEGADGGVVGDTGDEAAHGGRTCSDAVDAVEAGKPDVDVPSAFVAVDIPVEGSGGIGDGNGVEAVRREARQAVGEEAVLDPFAVAHAVGTAVLTDAEGVVGGGVKSCEGVGVARDSDVGGGPVGGTAFLDVHLVIGTVACPGDGGRLVVVGHTGDDGVGTCNACTGNEGDVAHGA